MGNSTYYQRHCAKKIAYARAYRRRNRKTINAKRMAQYWDNREMFLARWQRYRQKPEFKLRLVAYNRKWRKNNRDKARINGVRTYHRLRLAVLHAYSGKTIFCACCRESEIKFMTIDHIHGDGAVHRREIGLGRLYRWLKRNKYPDGFQVLCYNCNSAKGKYKQCPHKAMIAAQEI